MTWSDAWSKLNSNGKLVERSGQRALAESVFSVVENGGYLLGEAPVGTGKSLAYLVPLVYAVKNGKKVRGVVSTETTALQDQLVDKDLPHLDNVFGGFTFAALKGRSHYLCLNRAPRDHGVVYRLKGKNLGTGERRDVERVLGYRVDDEDWELLSGDMEDCGSCVNRDGDIKCYSTLARTKALDADIVVTNHALLRTHAEMDDGLLGDFQHLVVDEAHTLEKVLVDGWGSEFTPWDRYKSMKNIWDGLDAGYLSAHAGRAEEAEKLMKQATESITDLLVKLAQRSVPDLDDFEWRRQSFTLSLKYLTGGVDRSTVMALEEYELLGPGRLRSAAKIFDELADVFSAKLEDMDRGKRKVTKGLTSAKKLAKTLKIVADAMETRDGIVMSYGVPYVVLGDGWKAYKGDFDVRIRCIPLDVSNEARESIWNQVKSATLVSGTLRDETDGSYRYVVQSLGLPENTRTLTVSSAFDYKTNQLIYVTPADRETVQIPGARFSFEELVDVIEASSGRALVLFTAKSEMEHAADRLRTLRAAGQFRHQILVQEAGVSKSELIRAFMDDISSVLIGSKSFFTGVDFPGESCSIVVLAKFPLPQYNALCKAQIEWWRKRGHPHWYEREALQVFKQANGRLIRNEHDRGVIAILDQRASNSRENISKLVGLEITATGSSVTNDIQEMGAWLQR